MRSLIGILLLSLCLNAFAVRQRTHRMSDGSVLTFKTRASGIKKGALNPYTNWNPEKTYKLPVILMSFSDCDFRAENDLQFYKDLFNKQGFNRRHGPGCVADYFRDQSQGQFNLEFDVVGPIKLSSKQKASSSWNFGDRQIEDAIKQADKELNYADYDWDNDGKAEVVIIIFAGYGGNESDKVANGCIWPNTDNFYNFELDGVLIAQYSASPEIWTNNTSCGIGTICHEFSHVLGLPDFYPTYGSEFSVLDEWDLMDGGNYTDDGWCPPNYSAHEREYLGWYTPEDLTVSCAINDMSSFDSSGKAYRIVNSAKTSEYYIIENRQWEGWDYMLPNHGMLITHVDFNSYSWTSNNVNTTPSHHRLEYFHADGLDYNYFDELYEDKSPYGNDGRNLRLKNTSYPYTDSEGVVHNSLTKTSSPAATVFNASTSSGLLMGKYISDISESPEGLMSFRFVSGKDIKGDVNDDGVVNIADVIIISNMILTGAYNAAADINCDSNISPADIVSVTDIIAGK